MKHIACSGIGLVLLLGLTGVPAGAQNQGSTASQNSSSGSSLGEYARQVRKDPGFLALLLEPLERPLEALVIVDDDFWHSLSHPSRARLRADAGIS